MTKEGKVKSFLDKFTMENIIIWGVILAGAFSVSWGLIAQYILHYAELIAWGPIIAFVVILVAFVIAINTKTDAAKILVFILGFFAYMNAAYAILQIFYAIIDKFVEITHEFVLAWQAFNDTLQITFSGYTNQLEVVANNQRAFVDSPYGKFFFAGEVFIALLITIVSIYIFVMNRNRFGSEAQELLKVKWVIGGTWFVYALLRGYNTMLPLFVFAVLVELFGEKILRPVLGMASVAAHDAAERHGGRAASHAVTATVMSLAILIVSVVTAWYVGISVLFSAMPFTTLVFVVSGLAVGRLIQKKK